jgi:hypothetical protein
MEIALFAESMDNFQQKKLLFLESRSHALNSTRENLSTSFNQIILFQDFMCPRCQISSAKQFLHSATLCAAVYTSAWCASCRHTFSNITELLNMISIPSPSKLGLTTTLGLPEGPLHDFEQKLPISRFVNKLLIATWDIGLFWVASAFISLYGISQVV